MSLLEKIHHSLRFTQPDPLGGGLAEEIAQEQREPDALTLEELNEADGEQLISEWNEISEDLHKDPLWFSEDVDE